MRGQNSLLSPCDADSLTSSDARTLGDAVRLFLDPGMNTEEVATVVRMHGHSKTEARMTLAERGGGSEGDSL